MSYTVVLFILMIIVFVSYISFIWPKYGTLDSISQSYYELPKRLQPIFTFFCWGFALPAIIIGSSGLMFFAGAGIAFVGAAAAFRERMTETVHIVGAMMSIVLSQLAILVQYGLWPLNIVFLVITITLMILSYIKNKEGKPICPNKTWWIEITAFVLICITFGIKIFGK